MSTEDWWENTIYYRFRRIWRRIKFRLGIRDTGLLKLKQDVRTSEYEDIHILWDMIHKKEELSRYPKTPKKTCWNLVELARRAPSLCRNL
ncbi:PREDICTED: uncharacterized protein LOC104825766 [Tarenaya hassleriana]|uniref:uncharacterized protein LOC104825766 n=1 Tax=Tarenaya hassleriana TaxID=28532 RepID=UPI00053C6525|nr:PREDICTED: uncharacterized protein LOC104825766 [Tarenaya hassleriana]